MVDSRCEWLVEPMVGVLRRVALAAATPLGWWLAASEREGEGVRAAFPHLSAVAALAVAAEQRSHRVSNAIVRRERHYLGERWLERSIEVRGREHLDRLRQVGRPIVVATWHAGVVSALCAGLAQCGLSGGVVRAMPATSEVFSGFRTVHTGTQARQGAIGLMTAIAHLSRGETVVFAAGALQGRQGTPLTPFLGRMMCFAPGVAAIARMGQAALVPALCFLERGRLVIEVSPPITVARDDQATMANLSRVFERRFAVRPGLLLPSETAGLRAADRVD